MSKHRFSLGSHAAHLPSALALPLLAGLFLGFGCGSKEASDSGSFLLSNGSSLTSETSLISTRPRDEGEKFRLGYGYDKLTGNRLVGCLDPQKYRVVGRNLSLNNVDFSIIESKEDLARKLSIEINAEAAASVSNFTGSVSTKTNILKTSTISKHSIVAIASLTNEDQELQLESSEKPPLMDDKLALLKKDPAAFRMECGDAYTRTVTTGASMYLVLNITGDSSSDLHKTETINAVKAAFGPIFSSSLTTTVSKETSETLAKFSITVSCHSAGINSKACNQAMVTVDPNNLAGFADYVSKAKIEFSDSVESNREILVGVNEEIKDYEKPRDRVSESYFKVYFDYNPQAEVLESLLDLDGQVTEICNIDKLPSCEKMRKALGIQINRCSLQDLWVDCDPSQIDLKKLQEEKAATKIGKVTLWDDFANGSGSGRSVTFDFDTTFNPGKIYNLGGNWAFNDIASAYRSELHADYQLRVFQDADGQGRCFLIGSASPSVYSFGWMDNKATSIRLERKGDEPLGCN